MLKWLHHILEPHCSQCREEKQDNSVCASCETLKMQLEISNYEKKQLMDALLRPQVASVTIKDPILPEQIKPRTIPWAVRKQMLEAEDRVQARLIQEAKSNVAANPVRAASGGLKANIMNEESIDESINELEKALGLPQEN